MTHPVVMLWMVVVIASILLLGSKTATWFSWLGTRTAKKNVAAIQKEYVRKSLNTDIVFDIISAHSTFWSAQGVLWAVSSKGGIMTIPEYVAAAQSLLMIDIISYLENAPDKETALETLIAQMEFYNNQWDDIQIQLEDIIVTKNQDMNQCGDAKEAWDRDFYQWLRDVDASLMISWLENSKTWWSCQAAARIDMNAHKVLQKRVVDITNTLSNIINVLQQNSNVIINNFELFKDTQLEKLLSLRNQIRAVSPGTN